MMDKNIAEKMMKIAESFFGTSHDPDQIPVTWESRQKLFSLDPHALTFRLDAKGNPISWVVVVPTTQIVMHQFLAGAITERELFEQTVPSHQYDALYLCSAITIPEERKKGIACELFMDTISKIPLIENAILFSWPISEEGERLIQKLEQKSGTQVLRRQK